MNLSVAKLIENLSPLAVKGSIPESISDVCVDSRLIKSNCLFVAVKGEKRDGHEFIASAVRDGATIIVHEHDVPNIEHGVCYVQVSDSRLALSYCAHAFYDFPSESLTMIGITGTNGKTTISTLVYQILSQLGLKVGLMGTIEKRIGGKTVKSLLTTADPVELAHDLAKMRSAGCSHVVMEVSSHALVQQRVAHINFSVAGFTNLTLDHLDYHGSMDAYANAKKILFDGLSENSVAVYNADSPYGARMVADCKAKKVAYGFDKKDTYSITRQSTEGTILSIGGKQLESPLVGRFNAYNIVCAWEICHHLGLNEAKLVEAFKNATGAKGRVQPITVNESQTVSVFVDYAHTPDALDNILATMYLSKHDGQRLLCLFGCGGDRDRQKRPEMARIAEKWCDLVFLTSDNPRFEDPMAIIADIAQGFVNKKKVLVQSDRKLAIQGAISEAKDHDVLVIAGKGHEDYQEIKGKRTPLDDSIIASEALALRYKNGGKA